MPTKRQIKKHESYRRYQQAKSSAFAEIKKVCAVCDDEYPPYCLDFHHVNDDKEKTVGTMSIHNIHKLLTELCKCVVVCSNCHRKIHHGDEPCPSTTLTREVIEPILLKHKSKAQGRETFQFRGLTCTVVGV